MADESREIREKIVFPCAGETKQGVSYLTPEEQQTMDLNMPLIRQSNESYLAGHPEISALVEMYSAEMIRTNTSNRDLQTRTCCYFTRPYEEMDKELRRYLKAPRKGSYRSTPLLPSKPRVEMPTHYYVSEEPEHASIIIEEAAPSFLSIVSSDSNLARASSMIVQPNLRNIAYELIVDTLHQIVGSKETKREQTKSLSYTIVQDLIEEAMELSCDPVREELRRIYVEVMYGMEKILLEREHQRKLDAYVLKGPLKNPSEKKITSDALRPRLCNRPCISVYNRYPKDADGIYVSETIDNEDLVFTHVYNLDDIMDFGQKFSKKKTDIRGRRVIQ